MIVARLIERGAALSALDEATRVLNDERMDVAPTYESLARRVEKLITKAEEAEDDGFTLAAADGLRKILRDIATMHGKMATNLSVSMTLAESPEWVTMKSILRAVCDEVPEALVADDGSRKPDHHAVTVSGRSRGFGDRGHCRRVRVAILASKDGHDAHAARVVLNECPTPLERNTVYLLW